MTVTIFHLIFDFSYILLGEGAKDLTNTGRSRRETGGFFAVRKRKEEKPVMRITPKQAGKVRRLVKTLCANCDRDGNCLLLDDGEAHRCVQLISVYGIYCNYFKEAVLPADRELYEEIQKYNKQK